MAADERIQDKWSDDTVLPLINFELASFPTSETGGLTPFELKYGSQDAKYLRLPSPGELALSPHEFLRALDANLVAARSASLAFQRQITEERVQSAPVPSQYEFGDLVLWNPREQPSDHLDTKLTARRSGPYQVVRQVKNDVTCKHVNLGSEHTLHVSRLTPFFGSYDDALRVARLDKNQYLIASINHFSGNVFIRASLLFNISFSDSSVVDVPFTRDLYDSATFDAYAASRPCLYPLRYETAELGIKSITSLNKLAITDFNIGDKAYLNLRYFDGRKNAWFDSLQLPSKGSDDVVMVQVSVWLNNIRSKVGVQCPIFDDTYRLSHADIVMFIFPELLPSSILVDDSFRQSHPRIFG